MSGWGSSKDWWVSGSHRFGGVCQSGGGLAGARQAFASQDGVGSTAHAHHRGAGEGSAG